MNAQHTPGPWKFEAGFYPNGQPHGKPYIYAPNGQDTHRHVAVVCYDPDAPEAVRAGQLAAGRLLATAPDLLAACRELIRHFCPSTDRMSAEANRAFNDAITAIAKAKGRP